MLPQWLQNDIHIDSAPIHYTRTGHGDKPPLVLVHGFSDNGLCWLEIAQALEASYDIVMPDMRGHGLSARIRHGVSTDMVADLAVLIRTLNLAHPVVGGHSMGAAVTASLGARFPDLARALILEDPPWFLPKPGEARPEIIAPGSPVEKWIKGMQGQTLEEVKAQTRREHPTWSEPVVHYWTQGKKQLDWNFFGIVDRSRGDWQTQVKAITVPILLITADPELGGIITPETTQKAIEINPRVVHVVHIANTGHHVRFSQSGAYLAAVKAFLEGL